LVYSLNLCNILDPDKDYFTPFFAGEGLSRLLPQTYCAASTELPGRSSLLFRIYGRVPTR